MNRPYMPVQGQGFVQLGETEKQQNRGFSGIKKAAPIRRRLSEQLTCRAKNKFEQGNYINCPARRHNCRITGKTKATGGGRQWEYTKHKPGHDSRYQVGGQCDQPGGRFLLAFITRGCLLRNSSSANFVGAGSVFGGICLACAFSFWRATMLCKSNLRCSAKISSVDRYFLLIVPTCKAMRRSTSHHSADSDYSCSLALRRWRYSTSRFNAAVTNCPVLSPGIFTASTLFITSCGTLAATVCDFAFTAFVAMLCTPHKKQMQYAGKKTSVQHLTCSTPGFKLVFNTLLVQGAETTKPGSALTLTGLLTTNDSNSIEVAMRNHTTHPQGRGSHNLNKYIWRFIALSTAQPRVIHIVATSEQEARQQSPAGCVMVFAARIRQEVCRA